jgi:dienelactone hydrolase
MEGFSDPDTGRRLEKELRDAGNDDATVFIYEGVGHGFMNSDPAPFASFAERKEKMGFPPFDAAQAELAWGRLATFFDAHLK